jgi:hypothetical protein
MATQVTRRPPPEPGTPEVAASQARDDDGRRPGGYVRRCAPEPESRRHDDATRLDRAEQARYRGDGPDPHTPARHLDSHVPGAGTTSGSRLPPAGRIRVAGIGAAPMSTAGYQDAVEAVAVLIARRGAPHAEAA